LQQEQEEDDVEHSELTEDVVAAESERIIAESSMAELCTPDNCMWAATWQFCPGAMLEYGEELHDAYHKRMNETREELRSIHWCLGLIDPAVIDFPEMQEAINQKDGLAAYEVLRRFAVSLPGQTREILDDGYQLEFWRISSSGLIRKTKNLRIPITLTTPDHEVMPFYYDTIRCDFRNMDGSLVSNDVPDWVWSVAADAVRKAFGLKEEGITIAVPAEIIEAIKRNNEDVQLHSVKLSSKHSAMNTTS
jgi:hypothetical protein